MPNPAVVFAHLDKDNDKKLSLEEFASGMRRIHTAVAARGRGFASMAAQAHGRGPQGRSGESRDSARKGRSEESRDSEQQGRSGDSPWWQ